jgi:hypothetical protein
MMAMLMYTPSFLSWVQGWHIDREWPKLKYKDHILNALDDVGRAYHAKGTKPSRNTQANAAFNVLWQMFRGMKKSSKVNSFHGAIPEPRDAECEDVTQWLAFFLNEIKDQLKLMTREEKDGEAEGRVASLNTDLTSEQIFEGMFLNSRTPRTRWPGARDGSCPNEKRRSVQLDWDYIWNLTIPQVKGRVTLTDCLEANLQDEHGVWCDVCEASGRHLLDPDRVD